MKYKASEIVNRALSLADLHNTDFISNEENIYYLNDSWKEFYQLLINKGDKQFVKEVLLYPTNGFGTAEYNLPEDLYQIQSIKNPITGNIITRKAESEGHTSNTYEIINDKLKLYGVAGNIVMTYYTVPEWITLPDKTIVSDLEYADIESIVSNVSNSFLNGDNIVRNVVTGEVIASDVSEGVLIGGKLLYDNEAVYDFNNHQIAIVGQYDTTKYLINSNNLKYLYSNTNETFEFINDDITADVDVGVVFSDGNVFGIKDNQFKFNDIEFPITPKNNEAQYLRAFGDHEFAILGGYVFEYYNGLVQGYNEIKTTGKYLFTTKYGPFIYDGDCKVISGLPDTEFNFPNELYVQVLAASLAVKYAMKQNANVEGLNALYENYKSNFLNSLSQDVSFTRITNVYGA